MCAHKNVDSLNKNPVISPIEWKNWTMFFSEWVSFVVKKIGKTTIQSNRDTIFIFSKICMFPFNIFCISSMDILPLDLLLLLTRGLE